MCLYPREVVLVDLLNDKTGEVKTKILWHNDLNKVKKCQSKRLINIPCGKCFECCNDYSSEWSYRIMNECSCHSENCFITLTYKNNPNVLIKRDLQLFLKRLRKRLSPLKIRYFACGEYGDKKGRPHYHLIIFGWKPKDLEFFFNSGDNPIFKSEFLNEIWNLGFVSVGEVSLKSAKYCAKYLQKAIFKNTDFVVKPFTTMSLRPGIGEKWFLNNLDCLETDKLYYDGNYIKLPRYYLKLAQKNLIDLKQLKANRLLKSELCKRTPKQLEIKRYNLYKKFHIT